MLRLRHAIRLIYEVGAFATMNRAWWLLALLPLIVLAVVAAASTQAVVPYAVYTLF